jgi:hypothetical protein
LTRRWSCSTRLFRYWLDLFLRARPSPSFRAPRDAVPHRWKVNPVDPVRTVANRASSTRTAINAVRGPKSYKSPRRRAVPATARNVARYVDQNQLGWRRRRAGGDAPWRARQGPPSPTYRRDTLVPGIALKSDSLMAQHVSINDILQKLCAEQREPLQAFRELALIRHFDLFATTTPDDLLARALDAVRFSGGKRTDQIEYAPNRRRRHLFSVSNLQRRPGVQSRHFPASHSRRVLRDRA